MKTEQSEELADSELFWAGFEAVVEKLGISSATRFINMLGGGQGDYTAERRHWLDQVTLDELCTDIEARRPPVMHSDVSLATAGPASRD